MKRPKEASYYPAVQSFLRRLGYVCDAKGRDQKRIEFITKGIRQVIVDVFGVRAHRSRHSTEVDVAAVEVKRSTRHASLRDMNQAVNNSRLAHYCYLGMPHDYTAKEKAMAAELGIGLLVFDKNGRVQMVSESRRFQPSPAVLREFFRKLEIAQCAICQNYTNVFDIPVGQRREGGGWRKNVFAKNNRWTYFCKQCRERFENVLTERAILQLRKRVEQVATRQKQLRDQVKRLRRRLTSARSRQGR